MRCDVGRAPSDYGSARDFFAAVRSAAIDAERCRLALERMEAREGVRAQSYEPSVSGSRDDVNKTAPTIARMDWEGRMASRVEGDYQLIDLGCAAIYGSESGKGGLCALMGPAVADTMWWRACAAEGWDVVADRVGFSPRHCQRLFELGCDAVDFFGWANLLDGQGEAEGQGQDK